MLMFQKLTLAAMYWWIGGRLEWNGICDSLLGYVDNYLGKLKGRKIGLVKVLCILFVLK